MVGVVANTDKPAAIQWADRLVTALISRKLTVVVTPELGHAIKRSDLARPFPGAWSEAELLIVLGGDGTLLRAAKAVAPMGMPVLGVNTGHLGFLTELESEELLGNLDDILIGNYRVEERMMLRATVSRNGVAMYMADALNDAVITRGPLARMLHLSIEAEGTTVADYAADGMIISTPTGSTAYALSAGGPICHPDLQALLVTPICPHTFNSRSLVVPASEAIVVNILNPVEVLLSIDGQYGYGYQPGDQIQVIRSPAVARLVRRRDYHFYEVLRRKLAEPSGKIGASFGP